MHMSLYLKFSWKWNNFGPIETKLFHFHRISKNGVYGGGSNPLNPNWIRRCLNMYANAQTFLLHLVCTSKNIWAELSYGFGPSCLINLGRVGKGWVLCGPSWHGPSWFWAELSVIHRNLSNSRMRIYSVISLVTKQQKWRRTRGLLYWKMQSI